MKKLLALLLLVPSLGFCSGIFNPGSGSGSGSGGSSALEVFIGPVRSSPTASISAYTGDFSGVISGSTFYFVLNPQTTNYIHNQTSRQTATLNVDSGTIQNFNATDSTFTNVMAGQYVFTGQGNTRILYMNSNRMASDSQFTWNGSTVSALGVSASTGSFSTNLYVGGQKVCRADGTNCPSSSSGGGYAVEPATVTFLLNAGVTASTATFGSAAITYGVSAATGVFSTSVKGTNAVSATATGTGSAASQAAYLGSLTCSASPPLTGYGVRYDMQGACTDASFGVYVNNNSSSPVNYGSSINMNGAGPTGIGLDVVANSATGTNIASQFAASGATSNYGVLVRSGQVQVNSSMTVTGGGGVGVTYGATAGSVTITGLTASQYVKTDGNKTLASQSGVPTTDLSGTLQAAQFPALTGDVTTSAGNLATTMASQIAGAKTWTSSQTVTTTVQASTVVIILNGATPLVLQSNPLSIAANSNTFVQATIQNQSAGNNASGDFVATSDKGSDSAGYVNLGINGSGYSQTSFAVTPATWAYLYSSDQGLAIMAGTNGTDASASLVFVTSNPIVANKRMDINQAGAIVAYSSFTALSTATFNVLAVNRAAQTYISTGTPLTFNVNNILVSTSPITEYAFTASGVKTVVVPPWARLMRTRICGSGGGGAGGEGRASGAIRSGGSGGGAAACREDVFDVTRLPATSFAVSVATAGTGGAGGATAAGGAGSRGMPTSIYIVGGSTLTQAFGGGGGLSTASSATAGGSGGCDKGPGLNATNAGTVLGGCQLTANAGAGMQGAAGVFGTVGLWSEWGGSAGGGGTQLAGGSAGGNSSKASCGGGGSGGCTVGNVCGTGGAGGAPVSDFTGTGGATGTSGAVCTAGSTGADGNENFGAAGGGSGGSDTNSNGCDGGAGAICGSGGGAGGAGTGTGGNGGNGGIGCAFLWFS